VFLWADGVLRDLGTFGGPSSGAFGRRSINDAGEVVGQAENGPGELHAFLWRDGTLNDLGTVGVPNTAAVGINNSHQIFGYNATLSGRQRGFFFDTNVCSMDGMPAGGLRR
jgi:probable HAF family extracellular repeat protein